MTTGDHRGRPKLVNAWRRVLGEKGAQKLLKHLEDSAPELQAAHRARLAERREARAKLVADVPRLDNARAGMDGRTFNAMLDDIIALVDEATARARASANKPTPDQGGRGDT